MNIILTLYIVGSCLGVALLFLLWAGWQFLQLWLDARRYNREHDLP